MCLFLLGGECCSPARGGTRAPMAWHHLPSLNLHCLTAGALLTSIPWLRGLLEEQWASLRIRVLAGLARKHCAETTERGEEKKGRAGCSSQGRRSSAAWPSLGGCWLTHAQLCLVGQHPLMKGKMPPYASSLLGNAAQFPSPVHAEGLFVPNKHLVWFSRPCPDPLQPAETADMGSCTP